MRLASWKEIAAYLGRDVRTVLRWHKDRGLPVHRAPGGRKGSVFAETEELDGWLKSGSTPAPAQPAAPPPVPHVPRLWLAAAVVAFVAVGVLGVMALIRLRPGPPVASLAIEGSRLVARDAAGAARWTRELAMTSPTLSAARPYVSADLDGDARPETVAAIRHID